MSSLELHLEPAALADLDSAMEWYESQHEGLGLSLMDEADIVLERVRRVPLEFPLVYGPIRRALLHRFPYGIFFIVETSRISVVAITHLSRDPRAWQSRG